MLRRVPVLAPALVAALVLAGCAADPPADEPPADELPADELPADQLPAGVAATVEGSTIEIATVEEIFDEVVDTETFADELAGDDGAELRRDLESQILSQLVVSEIVLRGAEEDFGVRVDDDALAETLADFETEAGGAAAFDAQLAEVGLSRAAFVRMELPLTTLLRALESEFGPLGETGAMTDGQRALQEWGLERFGAASVAVAPRYGRWNPDTGEIDR